MGDVSSPYLNSRRPLGFLVIIIQYGDFLTL